MSEKYTARQADSRKLPGPRAEVQGTDTTKLSPGYRTTDKTFAIHTLPKKKKKQV